MKIVLAIICFVTPGCGTPAKLTAYEVGFWHRLDARVTGRTVWPASIDRNYQQGWRAASRIPLNHIPTP